MITFFYNSACSKCRATSEILEKSGEEICVVEYLKTPPTVSQLEELLVCLKLEPEAIVRRGDDLFSELELDTRAPTSRNEWIKLLVANPSLIERPIVCDGKTGVIGRPPEKVSQWLKSRI